VTGQIIDGGASGIVAELAFARGGRIEPHANPNLCWFIVIEGGGWVEVGDDRARVAAGDAVAWPPDIGHGAWTETSEMRAFVVEFPPGSAGTPGVLEGRAAHLLPAGDPTGDDRAGGGASRGDGALRDDPDRIGPAYDPVEGEPR